MTPAQLRRHLTDDHLPAYNRTIDAEAPLDRWISYAVKVLRDNKVETFESCEGGAGHSFPEPTVRFYGQPGAGYMAFGIAATHGLPVMAVRRYWQVIEGEMSGPYWELTFHSERLRKLQLQAEREGLIT